MIRYDGEVVYPEHKHVGGYVFRRATEICGRPLNEEEE